MPRALRSVAMALLAQNHRLGKWIRGAARGRAPLSFEPPRRADRGIRIGWADKEAPIPLRVDHIFRVFSNTKLITSGAALLLFEEGHFQLDDPIEQFIPQLANRRVLRPDATSLDQTEPAVRPITIRHLMSHSSGLRYANRLHRPRWRNGQP